MHRGDGTAGGGPPGYPIGTVANLTGLDPHTIRAWERRYGAVHPGRTDGGTRRYSDADVSRLQLLKALTDCGEPVRSVATLPDEALRQRLGRLAGLTASPGRPHVAEAAGPVRVALLEPRLAAQLGANAAAAPGLGLTVVDDDLASFLERLEPRCCDALVLGLEQLGADPARGLERCLQASGAGLAVVVYTFARRHVLARLGRRGARLLRGPLRAESVQRALLDGVVMHEARRAQARTAPLPALHEDGPAPARLLDDAQLSRLAEVTTGVDCECPNHLAGLVTSLAAFEAYSHGCESRSEADAALHARLARGTAHARAVLERLLLHLCDQDGIPV